MKKIFKVTSLLLVVVLLSACLQNSTKSIKDRAGLDVVIPNKIEKIVSTSPTTTEILVGLGLGDKIIAVDEYSKDSVTGIKKDVKVINFRNADAEAIIKMKPDILIASSHNASGNDDPFALVKEAKIAVVYVPVSVSINAIKEDISFLGEITNTQKEANKINDTIQKEVNEIASIAKTIPENKRKKVYFEIAGQPNLFAVGNNTFLNEFIEVIGAKNIFATKEGWIQPSIEMIIKDNPDIIITNESYQKDAVKKIKNREGFNVINAIKNDRVYLMDSNITSRSSQKSIEALKEMAKLVYPEYYGK